MARSDPTALTVTILDGPASGQIYRFVGRELPYRAGAGGSVAFGRSMRTNLTWYPGNRVASQQRLGSIIEPTTFNGIWKDRYLGTNRSIFLVELFEDLCDQGTEVEVLWSTRQYRGLVKSVRWKPGMPTGGLSDIAWEITFEWNRAGNPPKRTVGDAGISLRTFLSEVGNAFAGLTQSIRDFKDTYAQIYGSLKRGFAATRSVIEDVVQTIDGPITKLYVLASSLSVAPAVTSSVLIANTFLRNERNTLAQQKARVAYDALGAAQGAIDQGNRGLRAVGDAYPGQLASDDVISQINAIIARADVVDAGYAALLQAHELRRRLESIARPDEVETIPAVEGEDLRKIARKYYGRADLWPRLAVYNGLTTSRIPASLSVLRIPAMASEELDERLGW